jgi:hypothetical protein
MYTPGRYASRAREASSSSHHIIDGYEAPTPARGRSNPFRLTARNPKYCMRVLWVYYLGREMHDDDDPERT